MKKRIKYLLLILLLTTGCTCEYNLTIEGNTYQEKIIITSETAEEQKDLNTNLQIPIDKTIPEGDTDSKLPDNVDTYNYQISNNSITMDYNFTQNSIIKSLAVSKCYNKLTVSNYNNSIIISTSPNAICYEETPPLTNVKVNITIIDRKVVSHNADSVNNNTYTWNITKNNASSKAINLVIDNTSSKQQQESNNKKENSDNNIKKSSHDYTMYIFAGVLLVVFLVGYFLYNKLVNKNNTDDI